MGTKIRLWGINFSFKRATRRSSSRDGTGRGWRTIISNIYIRRIEFKYVYKRMPRERKLRGGIGSRVEG